MNELTIAILCALGAGAAIPAGALLAHHEEIAPGWLKNDGRHAIIAFGGGALIAAVALVLIPDGIARTPLWLGAAAFAAGGGAAYLIDGMLARRGGGGAQLVAMLLDFAPEAAAMGATFAVDRRAGYFLAALIAVQNLPESFSAYREIRQGGRPPYRAVLAAFCALVVIGPLAAVLGQTLLADRPMVLGCVMLAAAGGILYLVFEDVAPQARLENARAPALGAVGGMLLGVVGHALTG